MTIEYVVDEETVKTYNSVEELISDFNADRILCPTTGYLRVQHKEE